MLYKVTPMMPVPEKPKRARTATGAVGEGSEGRVAGQPRKKRKSAIYDHEGNEVLISLMCLKCRQIKPLAQFGLRKMADGAIRNQPWCRGCRSGAGQPKPKPVEPVVAVAPTVAAVAPAAVPEASSVSVTPTTEAIHAEATVDVAPEPSVEATSEARGPEASPVVAEQPAL